MSLVRPLCGKTDQIRIDSAGKRFTSSGIAPESNDTCCAKRERVWKIAKLQVEIVVRHLEEADPTGK